MPDNHSSKNILMLHSSSDMYGASKILLITASLLKKNNFRVFVVVSEDGPLVQELRATQVKVIICRLGILRRKYFTPLGILNRFHILIKAKKMLQKIVEENKIEIIYSNTAAVLIGAFVARKCRIKHIWHVHEIIQNPRIFSKLIGKLLNNYSDKIIVVSDEVKNYWAKHINRSKLITVYNGLDYTPYINSTSSIRQELNIRSNEVLIGMIGRVNLWKGQNYFLQMAGLLAKRFSNVKFLLAGDAYPGYEYLTDELHEIIKNEKLDTIVTDLGFRTDVPKILKGLDLFILPSILPDPLPTVVLEAMASGIPVIATKHGGALEMVDDKNTGILISWDNAEAAIEDFSFLINDRERRKEMGKAGTERVLDLFSKRNYEMNIIKTINSL